MTAKHVELQNVAKRFGEIVAVRLLSLRIEAGEFLTLLGPSGCGKTTLLRMIAGLESVTTGSILVGGADVTDRPPHRRDTSIMFQDYALFPHKSVVDNIAYGLKMRGVGRDQRRKLAEEWLSRTGLADMAERLPHQLSGGQRQRVALARALIINPGVLLLDEPLGALDANLRRRMQSELKRLHREVGLTFIYVTHDQDEAIAMSDRIAVMRDGVIEQIGPPQSIYDHPQTEFVARFIGHCNVINAITMKQEDGAAICAAGGLGSIRAATEVTIPCGTPVSLALRPEGIETFALGDGSATNENERVNCAQLTVSDIDFTGSAYRIRARAGDGQELDIELNRREASARLPNRGDLIGVRWAEDGLTLLHRGEGLRTREDND